MERLERGQTAHSALTNYAAQDEGATWALGFIAVHLTHLWLIIENALNVPNLPNTIA